MKSGQEIAKENVARLQEWIDAHSDAVPYLSDGRVNRSRLAAEAGLDRQVFRNNPLCRAIVEELEGSLNQAPRRLVVSPDIERLIEEKDKRISALTALVSKREAELDNLRRENQRLRAAVAIEDHMTETLRRFPPPSE
jgi:predicted RNase H-like nuclease (RuvC/YqgF family)